MKKILPAIYVLIALALGATFIYSAYTKSDPIDSFESFELTIVEISHLPWIAGAVLARLLIGIEAVLGLLIIIHFFGNRKWVLKTALTLLAAFSIYLLYLWVTRGNNVNCGCFGDAVWMSPAASLIKNVIMMSAILVLLRFHRGVASQWSWLIEPILCIAVIAGTFFYFPPLSEKQTWLGKDSYRIDLSALYAQGKKDSPAVDLAKGKHVIGFFSLKCPHCRKAAYKMHIMKEKNPALPFHMVIVGNDKNYRPFFDETKATNIPFTRLEEEPFKRIVEKHVGDNIIISIPEIDWVNNGMVEAQPNYIILRQDEIEKWLKK